MMKSRINLKNIIAYIQGNIRLKLYYSRFKFMIRKHIREQIDFRIKFMDKECYENGQCKMCGCATTALQMADKQCDKPCYPPMMNRKDWRMFFRFGGTIRFKDGQSWIYYSGTQPARGTRPPQPEYLHGKINDTHHYIYPQPKN